MKRTLSLALAATLLLTLFACGAPAAIPNPALVLGEKYLFDLDYEQALLQFDQAIQIEPKNPRGYLGKYAALELADRHDEAVQTLGGANKKVARTHRGQIAAILKAALASAIDGLATVTEAYKSLGLKDVALKLLDVCVKVYEGVDRFVLLRDVLRDEVNAQQYVLCPDGEDEHGAVYHLVVNTTEAAAETTTGPAIPAATQEADPTQATTVTTSAAAVAETFRARIQGIDVNSRTFMADDFIVVSENDMELRRQYRLTDEDFRARGEDPEVRFLDGVEIINVDGRPKQYALARDCTVEVLSFLIPGTENPSPDKVVAVSWADFAGLNNFPCDITLAPDGTVSRIRQYFVP